jgi:hypothetical protein
VAHDRFAPGGTFLAAAGLSGFAAFRAGRAGFFIRVAAFE